MLSFSLHILTLCVIWRESLYVAIAACQASFRQSCSPNRSWIILFESHIYHILSSHCSCLSFSTSLFLSRPPHLPPTVHDLWRIFLSLSLSFFLIRIFLGEKQQPWDALPPGWDGFMMCCQLAKREGERIRKHSKHVFLLPTIIWGGGG